MNEREQLELAERIIALARDYVLRDPNWRRDGPGVHTRSTADYERQERIRQELQPLLDQWAERRAENAATDAERARMFQALRDAGNPMRSEPDEPPGGPGLENDISRRDF